MANRTVSVALKMLIGDYVPQAEKAAGATDKIGESAKKTAATHKAGMNQIRLAAAGAAAAGAVGLHAIVGAAMDFDKAMSGVGAVSNATAGEMTALRAAALKAGADTSFSASQAAEAEANLARAGVSTADILGGALRGSLDLAAAGQLDLADAADISAQAMNIWKLKGTDVAHIADVLAAGANKSAADVHQLGDAMRQGGLVAAQMGIGMEDTVGTLAAFADRALSGSDAGTSLKTMLQRLAAPSGEASEMMEKLGINAYNAQGQFVGMDKFAGQLHTRLGRLSEQERATALSTIFGSDAVRAASVLYDIGAGGVQEYTKAVNDQGAAGRNAAAQLDNLSGDLEQLRGSLETALIKTGSAGTGVLRGMTQAATGAVNSFSNLPGPVQSTALALLAVGTAGLGVVAAVGTMAPKIREARAALQGMGKAGEVANTAVGKLGKGLALGSGVLVGLEAAGVAIRAIQDAVVDAVPGVNELTKELLNTESKEGVFNVLGGDAERFGKRVRQLADPSLEQSFNKNMEAIFTLGHAKPKSLREATDQLTTLDQALTGLVSGGHPEQAAVLFGRLAEAAARGGASTDELKRALPGYADALAGLAVDSTLAADGQNKHATAAGGVTGALKEEKSATDQLKDALDGLNGTALDAGEADIQYRDSLATVTKTLHDNKHALDLNKQAGRDDVSVVIAAVRAAQAHAQAVATQTNSVASGNAVFSQHVQQLRRTLLQSGLTKGQVDALIRTYAKVPTNLGTNVKANTGQAEQALARIRSHLTAIRSQNGTVVKVTVQENRVVFGGGAGGKPIMEAAGGPIDGPGPVGVDSIPMLAAPGEWMINDKARAFYGDAMLAAMNNRTFRPDVVLGARPSAPTGGGLSVAAGAVQFNVAGSIDRSVLPDVRRMVDDGFAQLARELQAGSRR